MPQPESAADNRNSDLTKASDEAVFQEQFKLSVELGKAAAVEKFAADLKDEKLKTGTMRLLTPVHDYMLGALKNYGQ